MRAAVHRRYGGPDVVRVETVATPAPGPGQVRVRVEATVVSTADVAFRSGTPLAARLYSGPLKPRNGVLGGAFAGHVSAVGEGTSRFRVGDPVMGSTGARMRGHAEHVVVEEDGVIQPRPDQLQVVHAAALVDPTAMGFLHGAIDLPAGARLLVNGASGAVGTAAVQLARHAGAHVVGTCSPHNIDFVRDLGADEAVDHGDPAAVRAHGPYDVVFDVAGRLGYRRARSMLERDGTFLTTVPSVAIVAQMCWTRWFGSRTARLALTGLRADDVRAADLRTTIALALEGHLVAPVDGVYPLQSVAEAHRHVEGGKRGHVVLTID